MPRDYIKRKFKKNKRNGYKTFFLFTYILSSSTTKNADKGKHMRYALSFQNQTFRKGIIEDFKPNPHPGRFEFLQIPERSMKG
jgi:hypothetical protein